MNRKHLVSIIAVAALGLIPATASATTSTVGPFTLTKKCRPGKESGATEIEMELSSSESYYEVTSTSSASIQTAGRQWHYAQERPHGYMGLSPTSQYRTDATKTNSYTIFATSELSVVSTPTCTFEGWVIAN